MGLLQSFIVARHKGLLYGRVIFGRVEGRRQRAVAVELPGRLAVNGLLLVAKRTR